MATLFGEFLFLASYRGEGLCKKRGKAALCTEFAAIKTDQSLMNPESVARVLTVECLKKLVVKNATTWQGSTVTCQPLNDLKYKYRTTQCAPLVRRPIIGFQ